MSDCLIATGSPKGDYMRWKVGGKWVLAHRAAWEAVYGPLDEGLVLHHHCGEGSCINLSHLEPMTQKDHMALHYKLWEKRPCKVCGGPRTRVEKRGQTTVRRCDRCRKKAQKKADAKRRPAMEGEV